MQADLQTRLQQMAFADRSFAGPFPYATNTPEKVFAGIEKPVPLIAVQELIEENLGGGGGGGSVSDAQIRKAVSPMIGCMGGCNEEFFKCVAGKAKSGLDGAVLSSCNASVLQNCMSHCLA